MSLATFVVLPVVFVRVEERHKRTCETGNQCVARKQHSLIRGRGAAELGEGVKIRLRGEMVSRRATWSLNY